MQNGTKVQIWRHYASNSNQLWYFKKGKFLHRIWDHTVCVSLASSVQDTLLTDSLIEPGVYKIVNKHSGTVLDLSNDDFRSVIGFTFHGGDNQLVCLYFVDLYPSVGA